MTIIFLKRVLQAVKVYKKLNEAEKTEFLVLIGKEHPHAHWREAKG